MVLLDSAAVLSTVARFAGGAGRDEIYQNVGAGFEGKLIDVIYSSLGGSYTMW